MNKKNNLSEKEIRKQFLDFFAAKGHEVDPISLNYKSGDDFKQIVNAQAPNPGTAATTTLANQMGLTENSGPMPGIDISKLDFVSKAKSVLDAAYKKDKNRLPV